MVMKKIDWHFHELVKTQDKIDSHLRKLEYECTQQSDWNGISPHSDNIAMKAKAHIAACTEDSADQHGIDRLSQNIIGVDQKHETDFPEFVASDRYELPKPFDFGDGTVANLL